MAFTFGNTHILTQKKGETINTHPGERPDKLGEHWQKATTQTTQTNHMGFFPWPPKKTPKIITYPSLRIIGELGGLNLSVETQDLHAEVDAVG